MSNTGSEQSERSYSAAQWNYVRRGKAEGERAVLDVLRSLRVRAGMAIWRAGQDVRRGNNPAAMARMDRAYLADSVFDSWISILENGLRADAGNAAMFEGLFEFSGADDAVPDAEAERLVREGRAESERLLRDVLVWLLAARQILVSQKNGVRVDTCKDPASFAQWLERAITATTENDIFG